MHLKSSAATRIRSGALRPQGAPASSATVDDGPERARARPRRPWPAPARSTRVRILFSFVVLLGLSALVSTVVAREVLSLRLDARVDTSLRQEVLELRSLVEDGRDPRTGAEFDSAEALFDLYLSRNVTSPGEAVLTFVDGSLHAEDLTRFPMVQVPGDALRSWQEQAGGVGPTSSGISTWETEHGAARATSHAFTVAGQQGLFVVTILPAAELGEIDEIGTWGLLVSLAVLAVATAVAWPIAGRVLEPVRQLTETARSISESDMTRRVAVTTVGEAADMAQSFNGMLDRLEAVLLAQREFVRTAGHEMRDPLAICRGHLELFDPDAPDTQQTIALVLDEIERMSRLVGDLEILADAEQRDFVRSAPMDLALFTHEVVVKAAVTSDRLWGLDAAADIVVEADRHRLTEAVMNLVHNAVMHTGATDVVAIGSAATDDEWRIWVRDTGVGIQDDVDLFEPYVRGERARARYQGAGLGLAIVRLVAESHGGRVVVQGVPGLGATFTIIVPREGHAPVADEDHIGTDVVTGARPDAPS